MGRVGFIGLGIMGKPMSKNLLRAGYDLVVFDLNQPAIDEVAEHVKIYETPFSRI